MKILLVSAAFDFPLGVYCLAAQLAGSPETAEHEVEMLHLDIGRLNDYNRKNSEVWRYVARLEEFRPDLVGLSVYLWNHLAVRELISITATLYPSLPVVLGGPELASAEAAEPWLADGRVWAAVRGAGEVALVEVVDRLGRLGRHGRLGRLGGGEGLAGIAGCSWWNGSTVVHEGPRPPVADLSTLASPYLAGRVADDAFDRPGAAGKAPFSRALIETYRGCYMECSYCQWGDGTKGRQPFPRERVFGELSWLLERNVAELWIVDAMFGYKLALAKEILRHVIAEKERHGAGTAIVCYHNQDFFDPELFDLYREANVTVEVDLQSSDREVLDRVGRGKWTTESFERHLAAFRQHRVPTSGAADLMIGLPRDRLAAFEESVDYLLRRRMRVNLYQTSIIPRTSMEATVEEDGTVFAELAPRPVLSNRTFPVADMVAARLLGHGVDLFRHYPQTARLLWRLGFERPVDLCRRFGELVWERRELMYGESHTHEAVLAEEEELVRELVEELCASDEARPVVRDLLRLEEAGVRVGPSDLPGRRHPGLPVLEPPVGEPPTDRSWLDAKPRYRRDAVEEAPVTHRLDRVLAWLAQDEPLPPPPTTGTWAKLRSEPLVALVYLKAPRQISYRLVDAGFTHALLERFTGHFTVRECLTNLSGSSWHGTDLEPAWKTLASLARGGFIDEGARVEGAEEPSGQGS